MRYYSKSEKQKQRLEIDLRDSVEDLWLTLSSYPGHKLRPQSRKDGTPITTEQFRQFLQCTVKFLYDPDSLLIFREDYLKDMKALVAGEENAESWSMGSNQSLEKISGQLQTRKSLLEKRLIENDSDSALDRAQLRGEIDGLNYAINAIKCNG